MIYDYNIFLIESHITFHANTAAIFSQMNKTLKFTKFTIP